MKVKRVKGARVETCNSNRLATLLSQSGSVAVGHQDIDSGDRYLVVKYRRGRPLSAPAAAYSRGTDSGFQHKEGKDPSGVDAKVGTVGTTGVSSWGYPTIPQTDSSGGKMLKEDLEAKEDNDDTEVAAANLQRGSESRVSMTERSKQGRKTRRTVEELRNWMSDERSPRLLSEESLEEKAEVETPFSPHDFGLHRWKEYAVLR